MPREPACAGSRSSTPSCGAARSVLPDAAARAAERRKLAGCPMPLLAGQLDRLPRLGPVPSCIFSGNVGLIQARAGHRRPRLEGAERGAATAPLSTTAWRKSSRRAGQACEPRCSPVPASSRASQRPGPFRRTPASDRHPRPASTDRRFDLLSLGTFVIVGLPDGMLGTAWPAMRQSFGVPVGDLGLILLVNTIGSVVVAAFVGRLIQRLGVSVLLAVAAACAALGGIGYVVAPGLWLILAIGPLLGAAAGMMDGGLNTAIALTGRRRLLNLLHGFYGIGTAVGPLVVTAAILAGSWRPAYLLLVALDLVAAALWALHHRRIPAAGAVRAPTGDRAGQTTHRPGSDLVPPAGRVRPDPGTDRVLPLHRPRSQRRPVGDQLPSGSPGPVRVQCRARLLRLLGCTHRRTDRARPSGQARPAPARDRLGPGCQRRRRGAHLVAAQHRGRRGRVRHPRRRPRRDLPGPHRHHPAADRRPASPARHRLAGRRRRSRRIRHLRAHRPPHRHAPASPSSAPPSSSSPCYSSWRTQPWNDSPPSPSQTAPAIKENPGPEGRFRCRIEVIIIPNGPSRLRDR